MLSERVNRITLSPTLRISARALAMKAQGIDVVDFSAGEPDFPSPEVVKRAAKAAIDANFTKYTANDGIPELKAAICEKLERDNNLRFSPDEVIVSPGAKFSLFTVAQALYEPGDDVLIPAPYWVSYPDQVKLCGANPVFVPTREEEGFRLRAQDLAAAITPNTKALILNYPCNPTGAAYSREELEEIAEVCVREQIWVISDEIYEKLLYDGRRFTSIASLSEKIKKLTIVINGFSKAFSMTGWRLGYAAGPRDVIAACSKVQSHSTSNATSFVQKAAVVALRDTAMDVERMRQEFERRRNFVVYRLRALPRVSCASPPGAFYAMPNIAAYLDREFGGAPVRNTYGLAYYLLKEAHVALIPGEAFGTPEHLRISFATSMERLEEGMRRIGAALARLEEPRRLRPRVLNNTVTKVTGYAETRAVAGLTTRNDLLAEAEKHLPADAYFEGTRRLPASSCSSGRRHPTSPTSSRRTSTRRRSRAISSRTPWSTRSRTYPGARRQRRCRRRPRPASSSTRRSTGRCGPSRCSWPARRPRAPRARCSPTARRSTSAAPACWCGAGRAPVAPACSRRHSVSTARDWSRATRYWSGSARASRSPT